MSAEKDREPISAVHSQASIAAGAVFLSYASEDTAAAERIASVLRSAGIEVWFDKSELRGGDAWDRQIREQIHDCRLFIPVISANSERRDEGYFRREWSLAADRTRDMAHKRAFLVPVVIDGTPERGASVPEKFHEFQWTRLPSGETPLAFVERVRRLLSTEASPPRGGTFPGSTTLPVSPTSVRNPWRSKPVVWITGTVLTAALAYLAAERFWISRKPPVVSQPSVPAAQVSKPAVPALSAIAIPAKSVAVLPFVDLSEKHDQEFFADGMAEEIIDRLGRIPELRVPARASSFYFKGKQVKLSELARELGVAHVLEGSVRKVGNRLRVTTQLIRADNGYEMWSERYDRELSDVFAVQDEIAKAVTTALQISLAGVPLSGERGGTRNLEAYQWYLRGKSAIYENSRASLRAAKNDLEQAIKLDPGFGLAFSRRAQVELLTTQTSAAALSTEGFERTRSLANRALQISPDLAEPHLWLGFVYRTLDWNWAAAGAEFRHVLQDNPNNVDALMFSGLLAKTLQKWSEGERDLRAGMVLDPLNTYVLINLGAVLYRTQRYAEAESVYKRLLEIQPNFEWTRPYLAMTLLADGRPEAALTLIGSLPPDSRADPRPAILLANHRNAEADAALQELISRYAGTNAYYVAFNYAYRNEKDLAFQWLDRAYEQKESTLASDMPGDPLLSNITSDPRYHMLLRKMNLTE